MQDMLADWDGVYRSRQLKGVVWICRAAHEARQGNGQISPCDHPGLWDVHHLCADTTAAEDWEKVYRLIEGGNPLDKTILVQYCDIKEEIRDIRIRINRLEKDIANLCIVSDTVKGTRRDGTYGGIKITGYPIPEQYRKKVYLEKQRALLEGKEAELLELTCQVEEYIEMLPKSELRIMFRLYYIDGLPWWKVAQAMNRVFPKRRVKFTEDGCRMRNNRFFEGI